MTGAGRDGFIVIALMAMVVVVATGATWIGVGVLVAASLVLATARLVLNRVGRAHLLGLADPPVGQRLYQRVIGGDPGARRPLDELTFVYCRPSVIDTVAGCVDVDFALASLVLRLGLDPEFASRRIGSTAVTVLGFTPPEVWAAMDRVLSRAE